MATSQGSSLRSRGAAPAQGKTTGATTVPSLSTEHPNGASAPTPTTQNTPQWLTFAVGSGAFAAFNGVFAKLTTASHTNGLATYIAHALDLGNDNWIVELIIRALFFGLNLVSNAIMWILFTRALTASTSSTRVAIMNTSTNFLVTAILGMLVFSEGLPLTWWVGAALLVAGTVVIGARESREQKGDGLGTSNAKAEPDLDTTSIGSARQSVLDAKTDGDIDGKQTSVESRLGDHGLHRRR